MLWPLDAGAPRDLRGLSGLDAVIGWTSDSRSLFVSRATAPQKRDIARFDLATGRRQALFTVGPSDPAGVRTIVAPFVSADGGTYAFRYSQLLSDLFVGDGLK